MTDLTDSRKEELLSAPCVRTVGWEPKFAQLRKEWKRRIRLWLEILKSIGQSDAETITRGESVVYAVDWDGEIIGCIVWYLTDEGYWWVSMGFVDSRFRGQGVYTMMWNCLVHIAQEEGIKRIEGAVHVDNKSTQRLMEKLGRKPAYINYTYEVPSASNKSE